MTHEARQLQLMRDVLRFVPDEHQREAGDALLLLMATVRQETAEDTASVYRAAFGLDTKRVSK